MDATRLKDVFAAAAGLPLGHRPRFLDEQCGADPALRSEVEALLSAHDQARSFLDDPTIPRSRLSAATPSHPPPDAPEPRRIGPYVLLRLIGEGGFGSVYLAEQQHPVRRTVAIKVIKLGMDTKQVIARFEAERQALAMMDHPNIARVFDAGATDTGRPYFVMELVDGVPITAFCDAARLSPRRRLELFVPVCQAVQHAHQKGIIHRDVKPSNVLVAVQDGAPVPKVIDFGVAKATQSPLTDQSALTEQRQLIGTPQYMSPEQADLGGLDVDTRSDVYGLGVLLYELLTGTTPFDAKELRGRPYGEIQRLIREVAPPPPSARLASMGDRLPGIAALRSSDPRRIAAAARGELDWIVMKCLVKDRSRRYETASALAADVRRFLDDEPVLARPPSVAYRLRKLVRRHRVPVAAAAALAAVMVLGTVGTTTGMLRARTSQKAAEVAGAAAVVERNAARQAQARAELSADAARREAARAAAVGDFMRYVFALAQPESGEGGRDATVGELLKLAATQVDVKLRGQPDEQVVVRTLLAEAFNRLEMQDEALAQLQEAHRVSRELPGGHTSERTLSLGGDLAAAMYVAGRGAEAVPLARETCDAARRLLGEDHPVAWKAANSLALVLTTTGRGRESHEIWSNLVQRLRGIPRSHTSEHLGRYLSNFAASLQDQGRSVEALAAVREAAAIVSATVSETVTAERAGAPADGPAGTSSETLPRARLAVTAPAALQSNAWMGRLMVEAGQADEVASLLEKYVAAALLINPRGTATLTDRMADLAQLKLLRGDRAAASHWWGRAVETGVRLRPTARQVNESRWRDWLLADRFTADGWQSEVLRDHVWCALGDALRDQAPQHLTADEVDVARAQFRLLRWENDAGTLLAEGGIDRLRALPPPGTGTYLLGVELPRPGAAPLRRAFWLPVVPWDISLHPIPRFESVRTGYNDRWAQQLTTLDAAPFETKTENALAASDVLNSALGRTGRLHWFAAVARARLDLPAGAWRFSATSDDGLRLWVDGRLVVDNWYAHPSFTFDADVTLAAGPHDVRVEFFQHVGGYVLWVQAAPLSVEAKRAASSLGGGIGQLDAHLANLAHRMAARPDDVELAGEYAYALGMAGRFDESAAAVGRTLRIEPGRPLDWYLLACLLADAGDAGAYATHCSAMLDRFAGATDRGTCQRLVRAACVAPGPQATSPQLRQLAARMEERIGEAPPDELAGCELAAAMAEYRAGRFGPALDAFRRARRGLPQDSPASLLATDFFAAMCDYQLGRPGEARKELAEAARAMDERQPALRVDLFPHGQVDHWLVCRTVRREAESLVR